MELANVTLQQWDHIGIVTINHPPANTMDLATLQDLQKAVDKVESDPEVRVVVLTGQGDKCFCAGFDLSDAANAPQSSPLARSLWRQVDRMEKPVIAALNGHAVGGGLELALCCHFRVMTDNPRAKIGLTELKVGIIPGWGGTQRLARVVGKSRALDMILFSRVLAPDEALAIGLVNQVAVPEKVMEQALALAGELSEKPPLAVQWVLRAISAGEYEGMDRGLAVEADGSAAVRDSQDRKEGFQAFLEKRKPVFTGR